MASDMCLLVVYGDAARCITGCGLSTHLSSEKVRTQQPLGLHMVMEMLQQVMSPAVQANLEVARCGQVLLQVRQWVTVGLKMLSQEMQLVGTH